MTSKTEAQAAANDEASRIRDLRHGRETGRGLGHYWTCDLGHEYVRINADYRT